MKKKYLLLVVGSLFLLLIGFISGQEREKEVLSDKRSNTPVSSASASVLPGIKTSVLKVVDGDTIDVSIDGRSQAVRLIGIDTPEVVDPRKPVQCFGQQASLKAKEVLTDKTIYLESDPTQGDKDKYKRLLRYVYLEDGVNFNLMMILQGYAHEYTYDLPYKYQSEFKAAEKTAMQKEIGLWSPTTCSGSTDNLSTSINTSASSSSTQIDNQAAVSQGQVIVGSDYKPTGVYFCNCSKLCGQIKTCDEAYYQLQSCGCSARDSDGDGVPCESICR